MSHIEQVFFESLIKSKSDFARLHKFPPVFDRPPATSCAPKSPSATSVSIKFRPNAAFYSYPCERDSSGRTQESNARRSYISGVHSYNSGGYGDYDLVAPYHLSPKTATLPIHAMSGLQGFLGKLDPQKSQQSQPSAVPGRLTTSSRGKGGKQKSKAIKGWEEDEAGGDQQRDDQRADSNGNGGEMKRALRAASAERHEERCDGVTLAVKHVVPAPAPTSPRPTCAPPSPPPWHLHIHPTVQAACS